MFYSSYKDLARSTDKVLRHKVFELLIVQNKMNIKEDLLK